jgi:hypothetical protein
MIEAYPLYWPENWPRIPPSQQKKSAFRSTMGQARGELFEEIRRLGGKEVILSTNIPLRNDGLPRADAKEPIDAGVAVYFTYKKKPMCFACDKFYYVRENIHAIKLTIEALRGIERWGASDMLDRAFTGFTALPSPFEMKRTKYHYFGDGAWTPASVRARYRELCRENHPDKGGDPEIMAEINVFYNEIMKGFGETI